ncbi:signal peptide peptidase SppA [Testudinibacter sp. TR-2022]|uniref:signal peptide peptidase SppA n=1 Tax=Testudinibacter sp. TR-2022 TaxID=2585029 RepID=UPI001117C9CF|nr:signal peptide peptidase SppA [Testudinibacter sp. TR-2022]TNH04292.1 signal peptide peptidase SppA [Pasteurellaceae bacterium Phil31]TNH10101.1 signal peptide peptidase SppA [Testudinibacter sp. TR-2022]TNH12485.1 signal peptide peptidase SppA [Testudinibacter sp. TR-2022]TNH14787.1 signal peptide peptidase SppA [Testudinibacter sp. TR-2022]TNH16276.1 signal peptide peptidase SppA [Testudinibacter sp. TR-2022]
MRALARLIKLLWRGLCFVRDLVINVFFILFVLLCFSLVGIFLHSSSTTPTIKEGALLLNLDGYLADNRPESSLLDALREFDQRQIPQQISTFDVVDVIQHAAVDDKIQGIVLDLNYFEGGDIPSLQFIGQALTEFKAQNKPIYAISSRYSQAQYLLASYADEIYINQLGDVSIFGLTQNSLYFKSLIDKLEITPHIFRVGTYKSAVEPFLRNDMSTEAKANNRLWVEQMWNNYLALVAKNRGIEQSAVSPTPQTFLQQLKALNGDGTEYAKQRGLVNAVMNNGNISHKLSDIFGFNSDRSDYQYTLFSDYLATLPDRSSDPATGKIAVVNVEGEIIDGVSTDTSVGGDSIAALLENAMRDRLVKAVILRINSPGGSMVASEVIRQKLVELRQQGIPVVVSMGGLAASGGYWIATESDHIVANPNTLTGSIGVFSAFFTLENTLNNWGINSDGVSTGPLAEQNLAQNLSPELSQYFQLGVEHGYDKFLQIVADSRKLTKTQVDEIAQGRIWLGQDALKNKLVDELGDFDSAIDTALKLVNERRSAGSAEIDSLPLQWFVDEQPDLISRFLNRSQSKIQSAVLSLFGVTPQQVKPIKSQLGLLKHFNDPKGQYIYCLDCGINY